MNIALKEAKISFEEGEIPVGAVIVDDKGLVIARAHNYTERLCDPTAHAEMQAITSATCFLGAKYLTGCTLYVTVEPCPMCAAALRWVQISRVVWGASDEKQGYRFFSENLLHPRTTISSSVKQEECEKLMKEFFLRIRK